MGKVIKSISDNPNLNYYDYKCNNINKLKEINVEKVVMGSTAHVIDIDENYELNSSKDWIQQGAKGTPKIIKGNVTIPNKEGDKGYIIAKQSGKPNARIINYECDNLAKRDTIDVKVDRASMGSIAHTIDNDKKYELNSLGEWIEIDVDKGGGGTGGTNNYNELSNKPKINNVELEGNITLEMLGIPKEKWQICNVNFNAKEGVSDKSSTEIYDAFQKGICTILFIKGGIGTQIAICNVYSLNTIYANSISGNSALNFEIRGTNVRYTSDPLHHIDLNLIGVKKGQGIRAKAVDSQGVVLAWETFDLPSLDNYATITYVNDELSKRGTYVVTVTANPMSPREFIADASAKDISDAIGKGQSVELHYDDVAVEKSGQQIYEYLRFYNNSAWFRRFYLMPDGLTIRQIDIEVKYNKETVFKDKQVRFATKEELDTTNGNLSNLTSIVLGQGEDVGNLQIDKLDLKHVPIQGKKVSQEDARLILDDAVLYEDKFIEFMANNGSPTKAVATGIVMNDGDGNTYLCVTDNEGHFRRYNKDTFESFSVSTKDLTKQVVDLDNLTIDVQGEPNFSASVFKAFNKPSGSSDKGNIDVIAYDISTQTQIYTDVVTYRRWYRLVTGVDSRHSFGQWQIMGLKVPVLAEQPMTLENGMMWYDSVENRYKCVENGQVKKIVTE